MSTEAIRVMLADDHPLMLDGLSKVLDSESNMKVVAKVCDGMEAVRLAAELDPDVIVMDINLPRKNGLQATYEIKCADACRSNGIFILTAHGDTEQICRAFGAGASAYCQKDILPSDLVRTVRAVAGGKYVMNGEIMCRAGAMRWMAEQLEIPMTNDRFPLDRYVPLSPRQMEVLTMLARGVRKKQIATSLGISLNTVKSHVSAILERIGARDCTQAVIFSMYRGWIHPDDL